MKVIHQIVWISAGDGVRSPRGIDQEFAARCGGGGWSDTQGRICRDLEKRAGRGCRHDVRRHDVPMADHALADQVPSRRIRGSYSVRRMPWVSGILSAPSRGALPKQVRGTWYCKACGARNSEPNEICWNCDAARPAEGQTGRHSPTFRPGGEESATSAVRGADLRAGGASCAVLAPIPSPAATRTRAGLRAMRVEEFLSTRARSPANRASTRRDRASLQDSSDSALSRCARMARAHRGVDRRARDLRRAAKSMVRAGVAAS